MNLEKVDSMVKYAYKYVPYYSKILRDNGIDPFCNDVNNYFQRIPILTKDIIQSNIAEFFSSDISQSEVEVDRTSGSTGKILNIYWEKSDRIRSLLSLWSQRKIHHSIMPNSKCCYFHSIAYRTVNESLDREVFSPRVMVRDGGNIISLSKLSFDNNTLNVYYEKLQKFQPEWIMCHPSTLDSFVEFAKKNNKEPLSSLKYIELTGEYLQDVQRKKISNYFRVPIANHYGAKEVNGIAYECPNGHLHCLQNNVYVEITSNGENVGFGVKGKVCVTGLNNRYMPFIRYDLGDSGILRDGRECGCGNLNPYLELCAGRSNDIIKLANGTEIECVVFFYIIEWINSILNETITQFQVLRLADNSFKVLMKINQSDLKSRIFDMFSNKANEYGFINTDWQFEFVQEILPNQKTEKLNFYYDINN